VKGTKAKSPKSRCDKVDTIIGKGVPGGGFDINRVMHVTVARVLYLYPGLPYGRKGSKLLIKEVLAYYAN
jgi:hypothetical protein